MFEYFAACIKKDSHLTITPSLVPKLQKDSLSCALVALVRSKLKIGE